MEELVVKGGYICLGGRGRALTLGEGPKGGYFWRGRRGGTGYMWREKM